MESGGHLLLQFAAQVLQLRLGLLCLQGEHLPQLASQVILRPGRWGWWHIASSLEQLVLHVSQFLVLALQGLLRNFLLFPPSTFSCFQLPFQGAVLLQLLFGGRLASFFFRLDFGQRLPTRGVYLFCSLFALQGQLALQAVDLCLIPQRFGLLLSGAMLRFQLLLALLLGKGPEAQLLVLQFALPLRVVVLGPTNLQGQSIFQSQLLFGSPFVLCCRGGQAPLQSLLFMCAGLSLPL